jgi:hypothetical protein
MGEAVNTEQLKKNVGQALRLRPTPRIREWYVEPLDYPWRLVAVTDHDLTLHCERTGHEISLGNDNVREFRTPDFLILKCQLTLVGDEVRIEPIA